MIAWEQVFEKGIYDLNKNSKQDFLVNHLNKLHVHHLNSCPEYKKIMDSRGEIQKNYHQIEEFPFLPVRLFKDYDLLSVKKDEVIKTMTSSGTTSQTVSKIYLDKVTAVNQRKALARIIQSYVGKERLPMLIIDSKKVIKDRSLFSARGAGILGMMNFGKDHTFLLDENMEINFDILNEFIGKYKRVFLFGFTFMVWKYFCQALAEADYEPGLEDSILIHSGGWKKMQEESVDNESFKGLLKDLSGINKVYNFYGMVEQTGSIFMECEYGHLHAPVFSDIIVRDLSDWSSLGIGEQGVIEVLSVLPYSYPGQALLTEDLGVIIGEDDCKCGRKGKYFTVEGRIPRVELRGCSDTYAYS